MAGIVSDFFWTLWLVVPVIIGCSAVAEERKWGVAEAQLCLPASRRIQFAAKFIPALVFGTLLGGFMPLLLEAIAAHFGAPNEIFTAKFPGPGPLENELLWFPPELSPCRGDRLGPAFMPLRLPETFFTRWPPPLSTSSVASCSPFPSGMSLQNG